MSAPNRFVRLLLSGCALVVVTSTAAPVFAYVTFSASCGSPRWPERDLPGQYWVNSAGSGLSESQVLDAISGGWDEWAAPCCSGWSASYEGATTRAGEDNSATQNIMSFRTGSWPYQLGDVNSTIAVTLPQYTYSCEILNADMVFNRVGFTFRVDGYGTDLQSIATHEEGHWLGLDHTPIALATMYYAYSGGTGSRTLHQDDIDGVCFLYADVCSCTSDSDCEAGEACIESACQIPPCESDTDCAEGLECNVTTGDCIVPPCATDDDCPGSQVCAAGTCRIEADCPVCLPCSGAEDCGGADAICATTGGTDGFCVVFCNSPADCPGNSECFQVPGQDFNICLNPEAASGSLCPSDYVCTDDGTTDPCDGVTCPSGQTCNSRTGRCEGGSTGGDCIVCASCGASPDDCPGGTCVSFDGGSTGVCTVECGAGAQCPGDSVCYEVSDEGGGTIDTCLNPGAERGVCPSSYTCDGEATPTDPCETVSCGAGETCDPDTGNCVPDDTPELPTDDDACPVCFECERDSQCGAGGICVDIGAKNVCTFDCADRPCPGDSECFAVDGGAREICLNADAARAGACPAAYDCQPVSGGGGDAGGTGGGDSDAGTEGSGTAGGDDDSRGRRSGRGSAGGCSVLPVHRSQLPPALAALLLALVLRRRRG